jgi:hypothetical protein
MTTFSRVRTATIIIAISRHVRRSSDGKRSFYDFIEKSQDQIDTVIYFKEE